VSSPSDSKIYGIDGHFSAAAEFGLPISPHKRVSFQRHRTSRFLMRSIKLLELYARWNGARMVMCLQWDGNMDGGFLVLEGDV
jgi:hypothetical protein